MDALNRRNLLGGGVVAAASLAGAPALAAQLTAKRLPLWPSAAPGGLTAPLQTAIETRADGTQVFSKIAEPFLLIYTPEKSNGSAIVLSQGGGYVHIANSAKVPTYFTTQGFTVFDLVYRLPAEGWRAGAEAPKQDGQRAMRLARKLAPQYGFSPNSIGVMGYSAGGHVAATTATTFAQKTYTPIDDADGLSARPDFAVLSCPVITMTDPFAHKGSRKLLIGETPEQKSQDAYSLEKQVTTETPPTFLVHADDDKVVPADNSILMALALRRANVPAELHLYREGGHGMGPGLPATLPASLWPTAFARWFERLTAPKA